MLRGGLGEGHLLVARVGDRHRLRSGLGIAGGDTAKVQRLRGGGNLIDALWDVGREELVAAQLCLDGLHIAPVFILGREGAAGEVPEFDGVPKHIHLFQPRQSGDGGEGQILGRQGFEAGCHKLAGIIVHQRVKRGHAGVGDVQRPQPPKAAQAGQVGDAPVAAEVQGSQIRQAAQNAQVGEGGIVAEVQRFQLLRGAQTAQVGDDGVAQVQSLQLRHSVQVGQVGDAFVAAEVQLGDAGEEVQLRQVGAADALIG